MKKIMLILLACALCMNAAGAEALMERLSRERNVWMEGAEETITEHCYTSKLGYSVWLDESAFQPACTEQLSDMYFESPAGDVSVLIDFLDAPWADVRLELRKLTEGYSDDSLDVETQIDSGNVEYFTRAAVCDGVCKRWYLVRHPQGMLKLETVYPEEAIEGYGTRIEAMVQTIEFLP